MKIIRVTYQKSFVIGPFLQEKVGFEAEMDDNDICVEEVLDSLRSKADEWHNENHSIGEPHPGTVKPDNFPELTANHAPPVIDYKQLEKLERDIDDCRTLEEFNSLKSIWRDKAFPAKYLKNFNDKLKELTNGRPAEFTDGLE